MSSDNVTQHVESTIATVVVAGGMYGLYWLYKSYPDITLPALIGVAVLALMIKFWQISLAIMAFIAYIGLCVSQPLIAIIVLLVLILNRLPRRS